MSAVTDWSLPFTLTNPYNGSMEFNVQTANGLYLLDQAGCALDFVVRSLKTDVPQSSGSILRRRFLTGGEMSITVQLWQDSQNVACHLLLREMLDNLEGAFLSLLNAGDNEGRLAWQVPVPEGDDPEPRMLDDIRLLVFPSYQQGPPGIVTATVDTKYPYAEDLTQTATTITDGGSGVLLNNGTSEFFPVYQVYNCASGVFTLTNETTGEQVAYDGNPLTGAGPPPAHDYAEIDSFDNTIFLNGDEDDLLRYVDIPNSLFPLLQVGNNTISIDGADVVVLWQAAWA